MTNTALETITALDARHVAWLIAHTFKVHGIVASAENAMSSDQLPALEVVIDGRTFLVNVEEL